MSEVPHLYNSLPVHLREFSDSLASFKVALDDVLSGVPNTLLSGYQEDLCHGPIGLPIKLSQGLVEGHLLSQLLPAHPRDCLRISGAGPVLTRQVPLPMPRAGHASAGHPKDTRLGLAAAGQGPGTVLLLLFSD